MALHDKGLRCFLRILLIGLTSFPFFLLATGSPYQQNNIGYSEEASFTFKSAVEELSIGGYLELEGRLFLGPTSSKSTFLVRRARIFLTGELYKMFGFMLMPRWDRQEEIAELQFAWLETLRPSWAQIRIGLFKEPFSLEALTSDTFLNFVERTIVVRTFCQIEDIGIMVYGEIFKNRLTYSLGAFNGRGRRLDNNSNKEIVGRLVYNLFDSHKFGRLYLGLSGSTGRRDEDLSDEEFFTEQNTPFWEWEDDVRVHSTRLRWGMDIEWLAGPFYFSAEYLYANWGKIYQGSSYTSSEEAYQQESSRSKPFFGHGGYAEFSYLLTGEDKPRNQPVIPKHPLDPCKDQWGAFEIAFRYEIFYASKEMIKAGFAKGANYLHGPTFAFNWYLNPRIMMRLDGQYTWFNRTVKLSSHHFHDETVIVYRVQSFF